jgi:hypothetical protein
VKPSTARTILLLLLLAMVVPGYVMFKEFTAQTPPPPDTNRGLEDVSDITVRGHEIVTGITTADEVFEVLKKSDEIVEPTSSQVGERLGVAHTYKYDGRTLMIVLARTHDPGPFVVIGMRATPVERK